MLKNSNASGSPRSIGPRTPEERSRDAARAGFRLTPEDAASIAKRLEANDAGYAAIASLDLADYEPSTVFAPRRSDSGSG